MPKVVFVGNFQVAYSTESHMAWVWENVLGWEVVRLQENQTRTETVVDACKNAQVFQWTSTHGWNFGGRYSQDQMVEMIRKLRVPSFSYHLDLYWNLNILDRRQDRIGVHPSWKLDYFFSTDGGDHPWRERGVNHVWMPPGVVDYGVYRGDFQQGLASDVGFAGSIGYHPEFPYRNQLITNVKSRYGNRFRAYTGMREKALNNTYASVKCLVGDHCFSTNAKLKYWSDRLPETTGRAGWIVYPRVAGLEGFTANGLDTYEPGNFQDLYAHIDLWLDSSHDAEKEQRRTSLMEYVRHNHTYSVRLRQILETMGF
jgi:hypothetical protein